jgi:hypothetical protein
MVGVGDGVGVGVGVGVGEGDTAGAGTGVLGDGANCACADDTASTVSTQTKANSRANWRPALILCDEQRIIFIPEKAPARRKKPTGKPGFAPSSCRASIGYRPWQGLNTSHCCSAATAGSNHLRRLA